MRSDPEGGTKRNICIPKFRVVGAFSLKNTITFYARLNHKGKEKWKSTEFCFLWKKSCILLPCG